MYELNKQHIHDFLEFAAIIGVSHTTVDNIRHLQKYNIPKLIAWSHADERYNEIIRFFDSCVDDFIDIQNEFKKKGLLTKHVCRIKDMLGIVTAFYCINASPKCIVNIGLYTGMSARCFLKAFPDCQLISIDPNIDAIFNFLESNVLSARHIIVPGCTMHVDNLGNNTNTVIIKDRLNHVLTDYRPEMIFLDGDHTHAYVLLELLTLFKHQQTTGTRLTVGLHDQSRGRGPYTAANEFLKNHISVKQFRFEALQPQPPRIACLDFGNNTDR